MSNEIIVLLYRKKIRASRMKISDHIVRVDISRNLDKRRFFFIPSHFYSFIPRAVFRTAASPRAREGHSPIHSGFRLQLRTEQRKDQAWCPYGRPAPGAIHCLARRAAERCSPPRICRSTYTNTCATLTATAFISRSTITVRSVDLPQLILLRGSRAPFLFISYHEYAPAHHTHICRFDYISCRFLLCHYYSRSRYSSLIWANWCFFIYCREDRRISLIGMLKTAYFYSLTTNY